MPTQDSRINTPLRNYFFYKSGVKIGKILTDGFIYFYQNGDHSSGGLLDVYQDAALTIPYSNPLQLNGDGGCSPIYLQDAPYYIEVWSCEDGVNPDQLQFTLSNYEGALIAGGDTPIDGQVNNLFIDGQFNFPIFDGSPPIGITPVTNANWRFERDGSGGADILEFTRFGVGDPDVVQNPLNMFHYQATTAFASESVKRFYFPFRYVRTLEGTTVTFSFFARSTLASIITPFYEQFFGTGGSPSTPTNIALDPITLNGTWTQYSVTFTILSAAGEDLGDNDDDFLYVGVNFPLNVLVDVYLTNMLLEEGFQANQYPYLTNEQIQYQIDDVQVGTISPFGRINAPVGWLECNGTAYSRITYVDLFNESSAVINGDTSSASNVITNINALVLAPGMQLTSANFATVVTVATVDSATQVTLQSGQNATASGTTAIRYYLFGAGDGSTTFNVPQLSRKTLVGRGGASTPILANAAGATGGEEVHTMTEAELVAHTHTVTAYARGDGDGNDAANFGGGPISSLPPTGSTGGSTPFNVMQPSLVVMYCIKT